MSNLIQANFTGTIVSFQSNAFLHATAIAKRFNKRPKDYLKSERTKDYIAALINHSKSVKTNLLTDENGVRTKLLTEKDLVIIKQGGTAQGTWLHPKLAVDFARWLNPVFAVWCDSQIEKILYKQQPPAQELPNPRSRFITEEQAGHIYQVVMSLCRNSGLTYQKVFGELKHHFGVNSYKNILKADYPAACRLLGVQPKEKLSMVAHNKAVRELSDYAITHLEANAVWRGVAAHRWGELELLANQLEKLAKKINHLKANLHDPILEQNFHFMNFDNEEIRRRVDLYIEMQNSYRS